MVNYNKILKKQLLAGADEAYGSFSEYNKEDLDALVYFEEEVLRKNNYKILDKESFKKKIKAYFGRIIDYNLNTEYVKIETYKPNICDKKLEFYPYSASAQFIYVVKNSSFITSFYPLPTFINYNELYKDASDIENSFDNIVYDAIEDENVELTQWKDIKDLDKDRIFNRNILLHRNKYLFNDSKASLTWLKLNDSYFLESLVKTFGYVEDQDLLKCVVSETFSNKNNKSEDYNSLFFMKNCSNQFVFHKATFDLLQEKVDNKSLEALKTYIDYRAENEELQNLSFEQKAKVLAHVLYIGEYFAQQEEYWYTFAFEFMGTFYEYDSQRDKYDEEFKKNNYYNLFNFEKLWETAKEEGDGIGLPM